MITLALIFLAQAVDVVEPAPVFFKRLGEQAFLVIWLVLSNWIMAKIILSRSAERIADLKEQIADLKEQRDALTFNRPPAQPTVTNNPPDL